MIWRNKLQNELVSVEKIDLFQFTFHKPILDCPPTGDCQNRYFAVSTKMNISSAIVYAKPMQEDALRAQLTLLDGVQVHTQTEDGRFIVTLECADDVQAIDLYRTIEHLPGALSVAMIFQQTESNPEQELTPCK